MLERGANAMRETCHALEMENGGVHIVTGPFRYSPDDELLLRARSLSFELN